MKETVAAFLFASMMIACSHYAKTNKSYKKQAKRYAKLISQYPLNDSIKTSPAWVGTVNFNLRKPNFVILHHTAQKSCEETLETFTMVKTQVSAHYVICKDGTVYHMLNDYLRAWQAGVSRWGNATDINSLSIGIEIDNDGFEPFTDPQINNLIELLGRIKKAFNIPTANFIGHADIAPGRKVDPNRFFPWRKLADSGFGYWYDTLATVTPPADFNSLQALRIIGYDIKDQQSAIQSFKIHFVQNDSTAIINDADRKILFELVKKYQ
jgi:N-acetylmuramoyl-L-alanine amidase